VLRGIADSVPSIVVVMSCLDDVYTALRGSLSRSVVDRLERESGAGAARQPAPARGNVEAMLARRLDYL